MSDTTMIEVGAADGVPAGALEVNTAGPLGSGEVPIAAAHPADDFGAGTALLLQQITGRPVVCVNMRGNGRSSARAVDPARAIAAMTDDLEAVRRRMALGPWVFWGMSGGGWIGEQYAQRHGGAVTALILESACACFRARLSDPACVLSPFFPAWRSALEAHHLMSAGSHDDVGDLEATEWTDVAGAGAVFRRSGGAALLVSPAPVTEAMRAAMPALWAFDARPWLGQITCPTLVLAGAADPVVPLAHARAVQQAIPRARWELADGAGHVPTAQGDAPSRAAVVRFLRDLQ